MEFKKLYDVGNRKYISNCKAVNQFVACELVIAVTCCVYMMALRLSSREDFIVIRKTFSRSTSYHKPNVFAFDVHCRNSICETFNQMNLVHILVNCDTKSCIRV